VLVDEVYLEAMFEHAPRSAFHLGGHFIVTASLTKAYGLSGLRAGWILAEPGLARKIWRLNDLFGSIPAHPAEQLSVVALTHLDRIAARAKQILGANRPVLRTFFESCQALEVIWPEYGTIAFPRLRGGNVEELLTLLRQKYETKVVPGRFFGMDHHFRIGMGGDPSILSEGLRRLSSALEEIGA
jgi:aspartate/methionine/tyrosine aminotransferase